MLTRRFCELTEQDVIEIEALVQERLELSDDKRKGVSMRVEQPLLLHNLKVEQCLLHWGIHDKKMLAPT